MTKLNKICFIGVDKDQTVRRHEVRFCCCTSSSSPDCLNQFKTGSSAHALHHGGVVPANGGQNNERRSFVNHDSELSGKRTSTRPFKFNPNFDS